MRGLDIRVALATARLTQLTDLHRGRSLLGAVALQAAEQGKQDAVQGIATVPTMFRDEPFLVRHWTGGASYRQAFPYTLLKHGVSRFKNGRMGFDGRAWRAQCEKLAADAGRSCGLSHDLYVQRFSVAVEEALHQLQWDAQAQAIEIAGEFDYATPQEREEAARWNAENGYCSHGITLGCCPAGCGSGPGD
jgi:hypothetical protein